MMVNILTLAQSSEHSFIAKMKKARPLGQAFIHRFKNES